MCRIRRFLVVLRSFFHSSLLCTFFWHPSPPTILPSSLTPSCHLFLGLPLNLVVPKFIYNTLLGTSAPVRHIEDPHFVSFFCSSKSFIFNFFGVSRRYECVIRRVDTRVGNVIVATIYLQLIQNRYMFRSFTVLQCSHQPCVQPVASDVEVVGYL